MVNKIYQYFDFCLLHHPIWSATLNLAASLVLTKRKLLTLILNLNGWRDWNWLRLIQDCTWLCQTKRYRDRSLRVLIKIYPFNYSFHSWGEAHWWCRRESDEEELQKHTTILPEIFGSKLGLQGVNWRGEEIYYIQSSGARQQKDRYRGVSSWWENGSNTGVSNGILFAASENLFWKCRHDVKRDCYICTHVCQQCWKVSLVRCSRDSGNQVY